MSTNKLQEGSTRIRLFRALAKFTNGLSARDIKEKTGMLPGSGHLAVLLGEEQASGRIKGKIEEPQDGERAVTIYTLTAAGKKALNADEVDVRGGEGRVGTLWTTSRRSATPKAAKSAKASKKAAKPKKAAKKAPKVAKAAKAEVAAA